MNRATREDLAARFPWPTPAGARGAPQWTGAGFRVDGRAEPLLSFVVEKSGWSDDLTAMHEADAGHDHPIDVASRERAIAELRRHVPSSPTIVEFGCSSGWMLADLRAAFPEALVIGSDYVGGPLKELARSKPDLPILQIDLVRCPLPDACVDAVVALNVLEHIADDAGAVAQIHRVLRPGGVAYIEVPAGPALYDVHDKVLMHERRYTLRGLSRLFERAGFGVERATHLGFLVFPAFAVVKLRGKRHLAKSDEEQREVVRQSIRGTKKSPAMDLAMRAETALARALPRFPFGVRCVLTAVKR
jgi:SAM-dependent methyltransferase